MIRSAPTRRTSVRREDVKIVIEKNERLYIIGYIKEQTEGVNGYADYRRKSAADKKEGKMKAIVSITLDNEFVVHDIKVIEGEKGLFIAMPSRKAADGEYRDIAHPINSETRDMIQNDHSCQIRGDSSGTGRAGENRVKSRKRK